MDKNEYVFRPIDKLDFRNSIADMLGYFGDERDYYRLHRGVLFFLNLADAKIELSDKVYTRPKDNVDDWESYFHNFRNELSEHKLLVLHFHKDLPMREVILHALLMVALSWTFGNS